MKRGRIAVIGAGPAGLTAALAGRLLGLDVRVYEQAPDFKRVGGGIMVHSNGMRVLESLGVLDSFAPYMRLTRHGHLFTHAGRRLAGSDFGELSVPHNRIAVVLRYQLQEHLLGAVERTGLAPQFGRRLASVSTSADRAVLRFADGTEDEADVVVAADGIHSAVRESLGLPAKTVAVGEAYLRVVSAVRTPESDVRETWAPDGRRFGICPLPGDETYFFCTAPFGGWQSVLAGGLDRWIESWSDFGPEVLHLLRNVPDWSRANYSELHEVRMKRWHRPPVFVTGDAAHAMTPNLGQGANSAMVDTLVLMRMLGERPGGEWNLSDVADRHETLRRKFATKAQATARQLGKMARPMWGPFRRVRNAMFGLTGRFGFLRRSMMRTMAGYNPAEEEYFAPVPAPVMGAPV